MSNLCFFLAQVCGEFQGIPVSTMYDVLLDDDYRKEWDEHSLEDYNVCMLDGNNDIGYYAGEFLYCSNIYSPMNSSELQDGNGIAFRHAICRNTFILYNNLIMPLLCSYAVTLLGCSLHLLDWTTDTCLCN